MPEEPRQSDHVVAMPSATGRWTVWRWACLRGAGFPASLVLELADAEAARAADAVLLAEADAERARSRVLDRLRPSGAEPSGGDAESISRLRRVRRHLVKGHVPDEESVPDAARGELAELRAAVRRLAEARAAAPSALAAAEDRTHRRICALATDPRLLEAVTWQNRRAIESAFAPLVRRAEGAARASGERSHRELVASYLQRYAAKNDTIGFFGPVGWARLEGAGEPVIVEPGPGLVAARSVHFEQWPIDALAKLLSADERLAPWMIPRRLPFVRLEGTRAASPATGRVELSTEDAWLLRACDGERTARDLAALALRGGAPGPGPGAPAWSSEAEVLAALGRLRDAKLVAWAFEVPLAWDPESALRAAIARVDDGPLREAARGPLDRLEEARRDVRAAAGDAGRLGQALTRLGATFTRLTGAAPTQRSGSMYAARELVFEDCRRDLRASFGPALLEAAGPPLSLVLTSARWLTYEAARVFDGHLRRVHADVAKRSTDGTVRFADVWFRAQSLLFGDKGSPLAAVLDELESRWSSLLSLPEGERRASFRTADLAARVEEAFAAPHAGWHGARVHSPDLMIAAPSVEAIARGEHVVVLGELHVAANTLDSVCLVAQHPSPEELHAAHERGLVAPPVLPVYSKEWLKITTRTNRAFVPPGARFLETSFDVAPGPREHVMALADLVVEERAGRLVVVPPSGAPVDILEIYGETLSLVAINGFRLVPRRSHTPRVTIDALVAARETWRVAPSEAKFAWETGEAGRFVGARRWARALGVPRFSFAKAQIEVKPLFVDLDSPVYVDLFAKLLRRVAEHPGGETPVAITEMLPGLHEAWLPDAAGERYTSELRIVCVDRS